MLNLDSQASEGAIGLLLVIAQALARRLLLRCDAVGMDFGNPLIALVCKTHRPPREAKLTLLEQA